MMKQESFNSFVGCLGSDGTTTTAQRDTNNHDVDEWPLNDIASCADDGVGGGGFGGELFGKVPSLIPS